MRKIHHQIVFPLLRFSCQPFIAFNLTLHLIHMIFHLAKFRPQTDLTFTGELLHGVYHVLKIIQKSDPIKYADEYEFQPMFAEKRITCRLELEPEELNITCDTDKMQRVFDNLLRNALLYGYEGSVISLRAALSSSNLCIQVENQGATIPREKLDRIFEHAKKPFFSRLKSLHNLHQRNIP